MATCFGGERVAEILIGPIKHPEPVFLAVAKTGFAGIVAALVQRQSIIAILVHELGRGAAFGGQQPTADQLETRLRQIGHDEWMAEPFRQPLHQMRLLRGFDFDRMARLDRKHPVSGERVGGDLSFGCRLRALVGVRQPDAETARGPAADAAENQQKQRRGSCAELPLAVPPLLRKHLSHHQPPRDWLARLGRESVPQLLLELAILLQPRPFLRMRVEMGFECGGALRRQAAIHRGAQLVVLDPIPRAAHVILLGALSAASSPRFISWRRRSRPRDSRDITVPIGTPNTRAACS